MKSQSDKNYKERWGFTMRKWIALLLTVIICLSLFACDKDDDHQTNIGYPQGTEDNGSNAGWKDRISGITWTAINIEMWMDITTTEAGTLSEAGYPCGSWEIEEDTVTFTYSEDSLTGNTSHPQTYQIKESQGVYFLVSDAKLLSSVPADQVPVTHLEITLDNWQEYFEFTTFTQTQKNTDMWGEVTEVTLEIPALKLKDTYWNRLNRELSSVAVRYADASNPDEYEDRYMDWGYLPGRIEKVNGANPVMYDGKYWYGLGANNGATYDIGANIDVIRIQGTLALINGL